MAFGDNVGWLFDTLILHFRDVDETVLAAHEVHKRTEINNVDDLAVVDLAHFRLFDNAENPVLGGFDLRQIGRRNLDDPFIINVDLGARGGHDFADDLATRADDVTDLRLINIDRLNTRGVRRQFGAGFAQRLVHFAQDVRTAFLGLGQSLFKDFLGDAGNFDVHLHRGDAFRRTCHLEIHIAQMIFIAQNVRQDRKILAFQDQAHGNARNWTLDRDARVHHRQAATADRRHRRRAVGLGNVRGQADRVRKFFLRRQNRVQRTPSKLAMADFATARRAKAADFTDRIGREVIVQHEMLITQAVQAIDHLLCILGAQGAGRNRLGFPTREQGRAMRARQEVRFAHNRADLRGGAAVNALAVLQDGTTNDFSFQLLGELDARHHHLRIKAVFSEHRLCLVARGVERVRPGRLIRQLVSGCNVVADQLLQLGFQVAQIILRGHFPRILGGLFGQLHNRLDDIAAGVMREHDGTQHDFFRQLIGFGFHHHHGVIGRSHHQIEVTFGNLFVGRVQDVFAIHIADTCRANRAHEGNARNGQCRRRGDHCQYIRLIFAIIGQNLRNAVDFVVETFGEQRTDRTVNQTGNQRFLFRRAAFTLEEATGNAASS